MTRRIALNLICLAVLACVLFSAVASAEIVVGVKEGDWMEYKVTCTGNVPEAHNVTGARIEVTHVEGKQIDVKVISKYSNGTEGTDILTLNLETGQIGDCFIIPANLNEYDTFPEQTAGNITILGVEEKTYLNATRTVVYANTSQTDYYWDRSTGFLLEANSSYPEFTMVTEAENTNIWQTQTFGIDPIVPIVIIAAVIGAVLAIVLAKTKK
jgi:hypothetical protein